MKTLLSGVALLPALALAQTFGPATGYNVFTTGHFTSQYSDTEGKMAIGGNASLDGYSVALLNQGGDALTVGGNLTIGNGGGTAYGNVKVAGSITEPNPWAFTAVGGTKTPSAAIGVNFSTAAGQLQSLSNSYAAIPANGTSAFLWSTLTLTGTSSGLNVFTLTDADLGNGALFQVLFNIPAGSSALVNVTGSNVTFKNIGYDNIDPTKLIWNLPNTGAISLPGSVDGTIFAPQAAVTGAYGVIEGALIASSFSGNTQINNKLYNGVTPVPEPASMAVLGLGLAALKRRRARKR